MHVGNVQLWDAWERGWLRAWICNMVCRVCMQYNSAGLALCLVTQFTSAWSWDLSLSHRSSFRASSQAYL